MKRNVTCVILALLNVSLALAQLPTATILGRVDDTSGAVAPGVTVTARNTDTNQTRTTTSEQDGSYRLDALPVGNYQISVEKTGFKTAIQTGLTLTVAQEAVANFTLQLGETSQTVSVTSEAPLVSTTTSSLGGLVDDQRIVDLPLNGRNYVDLTQLQPGITKNTNAKQNSTGLVGLDYSSNGASFRSNDYLLDGALLTNLTSSNGASVIGNTLGVDGIEEYRVITNNFSAEYGMSMGSQMVLVSKSGTNQFHGDAFEFLRNSNLDSRNYFDLPPSFIGHRLPEFRRNNFGGAFGGPVKKNKTFFFGVYEGLSQSLGTTNTTNVIQAGCHGAAGAVITVAACPQLSGVSSVAIAPQMAPFVALFPLPNIGASQYGFAFTQPTTEKYGQMRVDQTISNSDAFFSRYTVDDAAQTSVYNFPNSLTIAHGRNQFFTVSENHIFSPTLLNTARFSFSRTNQAQATPTTISGPQYSFVPGVEMGQITVSGLTTLGSSTGGPKDFKQNIFTWSDDLDYSRGHHTLKFGAIVNHFQQYMLAAGPNKGQPQFASVATFLTAQLSGYSQANLGSILDRTYHFDVMGFYVQDNWRVTPRLTLNLGMRYEPMTTVVEIHGIQAGIRNFATDATTTLGPMFRNPSLRNWSPRFGFAWDVTGNGHTAIRGGFAVLYDLTTYGTVLTAAASSTPPFDSTVTLGSGILTVPFSLPANAPPSVTFKGFPYYMQQPHMLQYNLTAERQLPGSMALTVAYAGSRGINLIQNQEGNPTIPNGIPLNGTCVAPPAGTVINLASQVDGSATSCWLSSAKRVNPNWGSLENNRAGGESFYNALEVVLNKRLSKGLQLQSSYSWSKLIDSAEGQVGQDYSDTANNPVGQDGLHGRTDIGPADFDVTNNWRMNAIYRFPQFTLSNGLLDKLINGWWTSGIWSLQSGYPIEALLTGYRSLDFLATTWSNSGIDRPDVVAGRINNNITSGISSGCGTGATRAAGGTAIGAGTPLRTPALWYDPCAFSIQPQGFLGNEGRNFLRGPGFANLDFSVVKDTAVRFLGEGGKVEFRTEIFNSLNHPSFSYPGGGVYAGTASVQNPVSSAGVITATNGNSRQIQFGLKILF